MQMQPQDSTTRVGWIAGGVGVAAFLIMMVFFGFGFFKALFLALILAILVAVALTFMSRSEPEAPSPFSQKAMEAEKSPAPQAAATPAPEPEPAPGPEPAAEPEPAPEPEPEVAPEPAPQAAAPEEAAKPAGIDGPRGGQADDLKKIKGVGPKLEVLLNSMGYYHYDQVANWSAEEIAWVDENLKGFKGRVTRDNWVEQAKALAAGN